MSVEQAEEALARSHADRLNEAEQCKCCGGMNPSWSAPSPLWNAVMRGGSINGEALYGDMVCMMCFVMLAEKSGIAQGWVLTPRTVNVELETVTPSGRTWDADCLLWVDPPTD